MAASESLFDTVGYTNAALFIPVPVAMLLLGGVWWCTRSNGGKDKSRPARARQHAEVLKNADSILDSGGFTLQPWLEPLDGAKPRSAATGWFTATSAIFVYWLCSNVYFNMTTNGTPFHDGGTFFFGMVDGFSQLVASVAVVVAVYLLVFPYQLAVTAGWVPSGAAQTVVQTVLELCMLAGAVVFTQYSSIARDWMFSQKAGLLFEAAVLVMKAHSYLSVNRALSEGGPAAFGGLSTALSTAGEHDAGAENAAAEANGESPKAVFRSQDDPQFHQSTASGTTGKTDTDGKHGTGTRLAPQASVMGIAGGSVDGHDTGDASREEDAFSVGEDEYNPDAEPTLGHMASADTDNGGGGDEDEAVEEDADAPMTRPRSSSTTRVVRRRPVQALEQQQELEEEQEAEATLLLQTPSKRAKVQYPDNVTVADFVRFSFMPTVVYSPSYPFTATFRWHYFAEKVVLSVLVLVTAMEIAVQFCVPVAHDIARGYSQPGLPIVGAGEVIARLIVPVAILMNLLFFFVFEVFLNAMAELTYYGDRRFYGDWWNSTSFSEFSRKWNKPIHNWLLHHVYLPLQAMGLPPTVARYSTFAISIVAHELVLHGFFGVISPWLMVFSLLQFPLFIIMQSPIFKGKRLGNLVFWFGMALGVPLVGALYLNEFCSRPANWELCGASR